MQEYCWSGPVRLRCAERKPNELPSVQSPVHLTGSEHHAGRSHQSKTPRRTRMSKQSRSTIQSSSSAGYRAYGCSRQEICPAPQSPCPLMDSQVNDREYADPHDVERVPEQSEAK